MAHRRRTILAAAATVAVPGCAGQLDEDAPALRLRNGDDEHHHLHVRVTGSENEDPAVEETASLEPSEIHVAPEEIDWDEIDGDLRVLTRLDHGEERRHDVSGGFVALTVAIDDEGSISFDSDVR